LNAWVPLTAAENIGTNIPVASTPREQDCDPPPSLAYGCTGSSYIDVEKQRAFARYFEIQNSWRNILILHFRFEQLPITS